MTVDIQEKLLKARINYVPFHTVRPPQRDQYHRKSVKNCYAIDYWRVETNILINTKRLKSRQWMQHFILSGGGTQKTNAVRRLLKPYRTVTRDIQ